MCRDEFIYYDGKSSSSSSVFHRAGYCNSTAPVEAKPRAKLLSYILLPLPHRYSLSSFPVYGGPIEELDNTVLRFAKCLIQS